MASKARPKLVVTAIRPSPRRGPGELYCELAAKRVAEGLTYDRWVEQEGDDPHLTAAPGAREWIDLVDAADELGPRSARPLALGGYGLGYPGLERDLHALLSLASSGLGPHSSSCRNSGADATSARRCAGGAGRESP